MFTVTHITQRRNAIHHSTYTGRPPDEPAIPGVALNEVFVPILQNSSRKSSISICRRKDARTPAVVTMKNSTPATPNA